MEVGNNMDKYLKMLEPSMKRWLSEHYSPEEAKQRWERTVALDERAISPISSKACRKPFSRYLWMSGTAGWRT